jgi:hypothetical protein
VRLSFSVSSSSPVVAAVRLALARSLRLGPPLGAGNHNAIKRNQPLRPWRRGKCNQQPRTTNALQCARRQPGSASSRRALRRSQFARSPNRFTLTTTKRATGVRHLLSNAGRRARCCRSCPPARRRGGHRAAICGYRTPVSAALSLPPRAITPHQFGCRSRTPTSWVIERPSRAGASTGES